MRKSFFTKAIVAVGVMASAMALSSIAVFADATVYEYGKSTVSTDLKTKTWDFTTNMPSQNITYATGDTIQGIVLTQDTNKSGRIRTDSFMPKNGQFALPVPSGSAGNITIVCLSAGADRTATFTDGNNSKSIAAVQSKNGGASAEFTSSAISNGYINFTVTNNDYKIASIAVTLTAEEFEAQANVAVTGITVSPESTTTQVGQTKALTATVSPSNATDSSVTWSSSDESIATVSNTGVVTGVAEGTATITVETTDGNFTATSEITVEAAHPAEKVTTATSVTFKEGVTSSADHEKFSNGEVFGTYFTAIGTGVEKRGTGSATNIELVKGSGKVKFETTDTFKIDLIYSSTGTGSSNVSAIAILDENNAVKASDTTTSTSNANNGDTLTVTLPAGVYYIAANDSSVASATRIHTITFSGATTKVSEAYEAANTITGAIDTTNAGGATVSAKYVYANSTAYFVLDFDLSNVATDVIGLKYQGEDVALYKTVQFAENDTITASDNHALHAFVVSNGTDKGVASVNATVTAVTE